MVETKDNNISVIGLGHVGVASALSLSLKGFGIVCMDVDRSKVEGLRRGRVSVKEEGVGNLIKKMVSEKRLYATTDTEEAIRETSVTLICVGAPLGDDRRPDLSQLYRVFELAGVAISNKSGDHTIVLKSTVPPGTTLQRLLPLLEECSGRTVGEGLGLAVCPEFLREGSLLKDSLHPDRLIFGVEEHGTKKILDRIYRDWKCPKMVRDFTTAEMIKYCANSFLAAKISFANEFANLCELFGLDFDNVMSGVVTDGRISERSLRAGIGFGGSCLPKDVTTLIGTVEEKGGRTPVLRSALEVNEKQPYRVIEKLEDILDPRGKVIAVLGLAYKKDTEDVRGTLSRPIVEALLKKGASIKAYDPLAMGNFRKLEPQGDIAYVEDPRKALKGSDAVLILTEWEEFKDINEEDFLRLMRRPIVIDGRRLYSDREFNEIEYSAIGTGKEGRGGKK